MTQTGPVSVEAKQRVARNAFKHGITSDVAVIPGLEDPREWEGIRDGLIDSFNPADALEHHLAERVALALWQLRRVATWNAAQTRAAIKKVEDDVRENVEAAHKLIAAGKLDPQALDKYKPEEVIQKKLLKLIPSEATAALNLHYEAHYHRLYIQALHEFEAAQTRR